MWKLDNKYRWLKCSCTCLSFNITQLYIWVILNLLAHIFKKEVVDTYQLKNLIELEADFDLFYFREKIWFWGTKIYTGTKPCNGRTDNMCSKKKNLYKALSHATNGRTTCVQKIYFPLCGSWVWRSSFNMLSSFVGNPETRICSLMVLPSASNQVTVTSWN